MPIEQRWEAAARGGGERDGGTREHIAPGGRRRGTAEAVHEAVTAAAARPDIRAQNFD